MDSISYLRRLGYKRITLKTGAYGMEALAMAIRFSTDAKLDLLTIDGAGGGTGMNPWNMINTGEFLRSLCMLRLMNIARF